MLADDLDWGSLVGYVLAGLALLAVLTLLAVLALLIGFVGLEFGTPRLAQNISINTIVVLRRWN